MSKQISRRHFIGMTATTAGMFTVVPGYAVSGLGYVAPSDKLNIAGIGIGGKGSVNLNNMKSENIVALCDIDRQYAKNCFDSFPDAKQYVDYRKMFDEMSKSIDAVVIATPDHTHAVCAMAAMQLGKHVYVQKPLTHSVYESRILLDASRRYKVVTQMGNEGHSNDAVSEVCEWIWSGAIGEVTRVDAWTDRPIWPQGLTRPKKVCGCLIILTGICSSARQPCVRIIAHTIPGIGADGGILAPAHLAIWPAMYSMLSFRL